MRSKRLIVVGPLPPPVHGVAVSTKLVLENPFLAESFHVEHLNTSDPRHISTIGAWDFPNAMLALRHTGELARRLRPTGGLLYIPVSQGPAGFLRDSFLIHLASAYRWKIAVHLRGGEFLDFYQRLDAVSRRWVRITLRHVDSVAVLGSRLRGLFSGFIPRSRIAVVPNGTPDMWSKAAETRSDHTVLYLSNLRRRKGVEPAVETACIVAAADPRARFVFAGEWEDRELELSLRRRVHPWGDRFTFLPPVSGREKAKVFGEASVFLFPPIRPEGHPRVVLEAVSAGLPVVTTDRGAISDTVIDGETGFVLPDPDPNRLAEAVLRLLEDPELRRRMGTGARALYLERFTPDRTDRRLADWLRQVAG